MATVVFVNESLVPIHIFESEPLNNDSNNDDNNNEGEIQSPKSPPDYTRGIRVPSGGRITLKKPMGTSFRFWNDRSEQAAASYKVNHMSRGEQTDLEYQLEEYFHDGGEIFKLSRRLVLSPAVVPIVSFWSVFNVTPPIIAMLHDRRDNLGQRKRREEGENSQHDDISCRLMNDSNSLVSMCHPKNYYYDDDDNNRQVEQLLQINPAESLVTKLNWLYKRPFYFLDDDGEKMTVRWFDKDKMAPVQSTEMSFAAMSKPEPHEKLCVHVRRRLATTLWEAAFRCLRSHRRANGYEWAKVKGIPPSIARKLDQFDADADVQYFDRKKAMELHLSQQKRLNAYEVLGPFEVLRRQIASFFVAVLMVLCAIRFGIGERFCSLIEFVICKLFN